MERDIYLGERIREIRLAHEETQEDLARALGLTAQKIKTWETGTRAIKSGDLVALADHYNCTSDFIVGRSENPTTDPQIQAICDYTGLSQWSVEELHNCHADIERRSYTETINAQLENADFFHEMAACVTRAAEARTIWRMLQDAGIDIHNPDVWNLANRVMTIASVKAEEYSPYNYVEVPDAHETVLLPAGSWFLTAADAADYLINRATELFREVITEHLEKWNVWPDLAFPPSGSGQAQVAINPEQDGETDRQEVEHGQD